MSKTANVILFVALLAISNGKVLFNAVNNSNSQKEEIVVDEVSGEEATRRGDTIFPTIGYLFRGYNIISGNPMDPDGFDPGFEAPIFKAEYKKDRRTADQRYKVPDNVDVIAKTACRDSVTVETLMTESEYQKDLSVKASALASGQLSVAEASFTASAEYTRISKQLKSNMKSIIKNEASCIVYEARIQTGTPPPVTDNFRRFVKQMAEEKNYPEFFDTFGTHFLEIVDMGARFTKLDQISKKTQESLEDRGLNLRLAAEASFAGPDSASVGTELGSTKKETKKYERSLESSKIITIGSRLPEDGEKGSWMTQSIEKPMPISYSLVSITKLFNGKYFTVEDVDVKAVGQELLDALKGYCKVLKAKRYPNVECEGPPKGCGGGSQCSANAKCIDDVNSENKDHLYNCVCKQGFQGDGKMCQRELLGIPTKEIQQDDNRLNKGTWGGMDVCTKGAFAQGFTLKVAEKESIFLGDDTAANALCLTCDETEERCSKRGLRGDWSQPFTCPKGSYLTGWRQNVQTDVRWGLWIDDTGLNNVEYECRDLETWEITKKLKGNGYKWGSWSRFTRCPYMEFICGLNTRVASSIFDETGLNDITHKCCKPQFSAKKMARMFTMMTSERKARKLRTI